MADFASADLLVLAKARYGDATLRNRMRGAQGDGGLADVELLAIADSVYARVVDAARRNVGWPFPAPYNETWPANLLQRALDLFNWRTISGLEGTSDSQRKVGEAAEAWFTKAELGGVSLGVGGPDTDSATAEPVAARARDGSSTIGQDDRENVLDQMSGFGWDRWGIR